MKNKDQKQKEKKPPLPKRSKWMIAISVVLIVVLLGFIVFSYLYVSLGLFNPPKESPGENISFGQTSEPVLTSEAYDQHLDLSFITPKSVAPSSALTKEQRIALAAQLYATANANTQNLHAFALSIKYSTSINIVLGSLLTLSIPVVGLRYQVKNGTEYYATEYALPNGDGAEALAGWFAKESSMFASRSYVDIASMDYMYSEKCYSPTMTVDPETGKVTVESDYSAANRVPESKWAKKQPIPVFSMQQDKPYWVANRPMTETNISDATVEYVKSDAGNYYSIVLELDVTKPETYENTIGELRAGAGEDAKYDKMTETLEIWENGYYKRFHSLDLCSAKNGFMTFDFDFDTSFFYGPESTNPANYDNFIEIKQIATEYNALQK